MKFVNLIYLIFVGITAQANPVSNDVSACPRCRQMDVLVERRDWLGAIRYLAEFSIDTRVPSLAQREANGVVRLCGSLMPLEDEGVDLAEICLSLKQRFPRLIKAGMDELPTAMKTDLQNRLAEVASAADGNGGPLPPSPGVHKK